MKTHTKAFLFWLPLMTLLTLLGWLVLGALPQMHLTGDLVAWLMELPVVTCYAIAAGGATVLTMEVTGLNLKNEFRAQLIERVAVIGDQFALQLLKQEAYAWIGFTAIYALLFFPHW